jgi:5'-nucleotidase (lipoprotein e(P4) family)
MKRFSFFLPSIFLLAISCASSKNKIAQPSSSGNELVAYAPLWAALYQQKASEYKALATQAYNIAHERLDAEILGKSDKPFAVVTDIDETVLDNSPYTVHQALLNKTYSDSSWKEWTSLAQADSVPGAPNFFKYAASKNVEVFYITNRSIPEMTATIANLKKWGFPYADEKHLLLKTTTSSKDARRAEVAEKYNILLFFGDNLGDFQGIFDHKTNDERDAIVKQEADLFGKKFIVLPNPMYGEWQNASIKYNYKQATSEKAKTMIEGLKNY